jgi:hypothetical protein
LLWQIDEEEAGGGRCKNKPVVGSASDDQFQTILKKTKTQQQQQQKKKSQVSSKGRRSRKRKTQGRGGNLGYWDGTMDAIDAGVLPSSLAEGLLPSSMTEGKAPKKIAIRLTPRQEALAVHTAGTAAEFDKLQKQTALMYELQPERVTRGMMAKRKQVGEWWATLHEYDRPTVDHARALAFLVEEAKTESGAQAIVSFPRRSDTMQRVADRAVLWQQTAVNDIQRHLQKQRARGVLDDEPKWRHLKQFVSRDDHVTYEEHTNRIRRDFEENYGGQQQAGGGPLSAAKSEARELLRDAFFGQNTGQ